MINPKTINLDQRLKLEARLKETHPHLTFEYSPAFRHYYISDKKKKERSDNISLYELYNRVASGEFK